MDENTNTDVVTGDSPASDAPVSEGVVSAPADVQGEAAPQTEGQVQTVDDKAGEAAAPFKVPENDDDLKGKENDPHVQAIIQMRNELRTRDKSLDSYKTLDSWKPVAETIGDPTLAQSAYELASSIHTPIPRTAENPSGFTTIPFLDRIEKESPGTLNQLHRDISSFEYIDENGRRTTVVREMYRDHGLDPDRIEDYRNIDKLRASGVVTAEDLSKIPEKYHDAFRSLSQAAREDLLSVTETNPLMAEEYLRNAQDALEARNYRQQQEQSLAQQQEAEEAAFQQQVIDAVEQDVLGKVKAWSDSIHQNLSSQWKPSSDEATNNLEYAKVMSVLATLQSPAYRFVAENALKAVGVSLDGFDDLINQWQASRSAYVTFTQMKDQWQAKREESKASLAEQRILIKLNDFALKLAQVGGNRLAAQSQQAAAQLAAASGRFVPSGNGMGQQGFTNPYDANPHPMGTPEYYAFNKKIDREVGITNSAQMFPGN